MIFISQLRGLFGLREEGQGVEGSGVELARNRLISYQIYSTLPISPSIQTGHKVFLRRFTY